MATSQNGYPAILSASSPHLHKWLVPGTNRYFTIREGSTGFLLAITALYFHEKVERLDLGVWDEWGWAYRPVRGSTVLSNHSSGTAVDLNATKHPLGVEAKATFTKAQRVAIHDWLDRLDGTVRWGGDYSGRPDGMHFEIDEPLVACEVVAQRFITAPRGQRVLAANPGQQAVIES